MFRMRLIGRPSGTPIAAAAARALDGPPTPKAAREFCGSPSRHKPRSALGWKSRLAARSDAWVRTTRARAHLPSMRLRRRFSPDIRTDTRHLCPGEMAVLERPHRFRSVEQVFAEGQSHRHQALPCPVVRHMLFCCDVCCCTSDCTPKQRVAVGFWSPF